MSFVHLHCHTHYSLLDGANRIPALCNQAKKMGMPALAITDHGNLYGAIEFYREATKAGVKPIIGYEAYVAPGKRQERNAEGIAEAAYHLTLLAKNHTGYKNLIKLASTAFLDGFYYRPRIDKQALADHRDGIIVLSGCSSGEFCTHILNGDAQRAALLTEWFEDFFGEDFYIELMHDGSTRQETCTDVSLDIARDMGFPIVCTADTHYLCKADAEAHDILLCINTGKKFNDPDRMKMDCDEYYLRSPDEMRATFGNEAVANTLAIADKCNVEIDLKTRHFPPFIPPEDKTHEQYLRELCERGITDRYGMEVPKYVLDRFESEFNVISRMGFAGYFLVVADFVRFAREKGIPVSARGSACGSLVSYVLGLSIVDPLQHGLLFERFLDPSRSEAPDIDIDFCSDRRDQVCEYVRRKYGNDSVANIITFGTLGARAAVRDVGRVYDMELSFVNDIVKLIPDEKDPDNPSKGISLDDAMEKSPDLKRRYTAEPAVRKLIDMARKIEGTNRHTGVHAAGIVIADKPLVEYVPLAKNGDVVTTQWGMGDLEKVGLLKMDFLGLRNLTVLSKAMQLAGITRLDNTELNDPATFDLIRSGNTGGIFQLDTDSARKIIADMKPDCFNDIIAINALNRPATLKNGMVDEYIAVKQGRSKPEYPHPAMEKILGQTHGVMVYQEQVMQILHAVGGIELSKAYTCIKAISKKQNDKIQQYYANFMDGAIANGVSTEQARRIFGLIQAFGGYGFNKSHSAAYAMIAYQTAYMKAHYPVEFMAALLSSELSNPEKLSEHLDNCRSMGIEVVPPNVNEGDVDFVVRDGRIHCSLACIRNVSARGAKAIAAARQERPFTGLFDFCERIDSSTINRAGLEMLIKAGAFDSFGARRSQLIDSIPRAINYAERRLKDRKRGQRGLFGGEGLADVAESFVDTPEWFDDEKLAYEKQALGFYLTGNPFKPYLETFQSYGTCRITDLEHLRSGESVVIGGMISNVKYGSTRRPSKGGNYRMAKFDFSDLTGAVPCVMFPDDLIRQAEIVIDDHICFVQAKVDHSYERVGLIVQKVVPLKCAKSHFGRAIIVKVEPGAYDPANLHALCDELQAEHQGLSVRIEVTTMDGRKICLQPRFYGVADGPG